MRAIDRVLERLENVRQHNGYYMASCPNPNHGQRRGDRDPSLSISEGDGGRVLMTCKAGCDTRDILTSIYLEMKDLFERRNGYRGGGSYTSAKTTSTDQPPTLANYAEYVGLPIEFLKSLGLKEYRHLGEPAVSMPYLDQSGQEVLLLGNQPLQLSKLLVR